MTALRGSCLFGGVRFEIDGPLDAVLALSLVVVPEGAWCAIPYAGPGCRRHSTTTPASAPMRTRMSLTRAHGSRSPTTCRNTRGVSLARTHPTIPTRRIATKPLQEATR